MLGVWRMCGSMYAVLSPGSPNPKSLPPGSPPPWEPPPPGVPPEQVAQGQRLAPGVVLKGPADSHLHTRCWGSGL